MSPQIVFKRGEFQEFTATRDFSLGERGVKIRKGSEMQFDGSCIIYNGSAPTPLDQLQGAIKAGWVVPSLSYDPAARQASISAGVRVSNAIGGNPMDPRVRTALTSVAAEEQEVAVIADRTQGTQVHNAQRQNRMGGTTVVADQEGVPVRTLSNPARQDVSLDDESMGEALRRANNVRIQPGVGQTREQLVAGMSEAERAAYLAEIEARRAAKVGASTTDASGITLTTSVGPSGGLALDLGSGSGEGQPSVDVVEVDGVILTNTNGPKRATVQKDLDARRVIAKSICPDFPDNYNFNDPLRKKIARLQADFEDRPDVIRAVAAAETDSEIKTRLVEEFPAAF